jgi:hypothetical protein
MVKNAKLVEFLSALNALEIILKLIVRFVILIIIWLWLMKN